MKDNWITRREFLRRIGYTSGGILALNSLPYTGIDLVNTARADIVSNIFYAKNGTPVQNINKLFEIMGGILNFIGGDDVVVIKPNGQNIRQGGTNTNSLKALIDLILSIPGFTGEIIIAENNHSDDPENENMMWNVTDHRFNGPWSFNSLLQYYNDNQELYPAIHDHGNGINVGKYILNDARHGGNETNGPSEGDGYVRRTDLEYFVPEGGWEYGQNWPYESTIMSYPILTSSHSGITVDIKNGCWYNNEYINTRCTLIVMSALNHHGSYVGVTSAVKNHLGIVELARSFYGQYADFHTVGFPASGGAVGMFNHEIRRADLYLTSAEWCGYNGRTDLNPAETKTVIASADPLALDYWASKYVMYPLGGANQELNNPDNEDGPFRKFLNFYLDEVQWGTLTESEMFVQGFDFENPTVTRADIDQKIAQFKNGEATEEEVLNLIEQYNNGE